MPTENFMASNVTPFRAKEIPRVNIELTGLLGRMQDYFYNNSIYPDRGAAGFAALSTFAVMVGHKKLSPTKSKLNLYSGLIVPSTWGKDKMKDCVTDLLDLSRFSFRRIPTSASAQALHNRLTYQEMKELKFCKDLDGDDWKDEARELITTGQGIPATSFILDDEFHQFLSADNRFSKGRRNLLLTACTEKKYLMPEESMSNDYIPVNQPHLHILGFSTPSQMAQVLTNDSADSGFLNRWIFYTMGKCPPKSYDNFDGVKFEPNDTDKRFFKEYKTLQQSIVPWSTGAFEAWKQLDIAEIEPMKHEEANGVIAGRLGEQSLIIATLLAINDMPLNPTVSDYHIKQAWLIRCQLHHAFMIMMGMEGGVDGTDHSRAVNKVQQTIARAFDRCTKAEKEQRISRMQLKQNCKEFKNLSTHQQDEILRELNSEGFISRTYSSRGESVVPFIGSDIGGKSVSDN